MVGGKRFKRYVFAHELRIQGVYQGTFDFHEDKSYSFTISPAIFGYGIENLREIWELDSRPEQSSKNSGLRSRKSKKITQQQYPIDQ